MYDISQNYLLPFSVVIQNVIFLSTASVFYLFLQEYVDTPVTIVMTPERQNPQAVTRSREQAPPEELSVLVIPGKYYAIRTDIRDFEDGFCIVKANQRFTSVFQGVYLDKNVDQTDICAVCFKETTNIGRFDFGTIICEIISANNVIHNSLIVNADEIEDIIASANVDN